MIIQAKLIISVPSKVYRIKVSNDTHSKTYKMNPHAQSIIDFAVYNFCKDFNISTQHVFFAGITKGKWFFVQGNLQHANF